MFECFKIKRKPLRYEQRKKLLKYLYSDIENEYFEQNIATNLYTLFMEVLDNIPKEHIIDSQTIALFEDAIKDRIKKD